MSWNAETNIKGPPGPTGPVGPAGPAGGIGEAPTDGQTYGRQNSGWTVVISGGGAASGVTVTPAGDIQATNVQAALQELDTEKVSKRSTGDTMAGNLTINKAFPSLILQKTAAGQASQLAAYNGPQARWAMSLGDSTAEGGSNAGSDFAIYNYTDAGTSIGTPLTIKRSNGAVTLTGTLTLAADPAVALGAATKQYVDSNIRGVLNLIINGTFQFNQTGYTSAAVLAAGAYGHDQWKAGAAGGDYTFTQLKSSTQITIAAGKTLIQPIEDVYVAGGSYVLSWTGTAQARAGVNTLTPAGGYAASPLTISGQTAGTVMSVEFNAGTLSNVKLESGTVATPYQVPEYASELQRCQRYFCKSFALGTKPADAVSLSDQMAAFAAAANAAIDSQRIFYPVRMRIVPTVTYYSSSNGTPTPGKWQLYTTSWVNCTTTNTVDGSELSFLVGLAVATGTATAGGYICAGQWTASARF